MGEPDQYGIDCQNRDLGLHTFQIPPPKLFGRDIDPSETTTSIEPVNLLCPECRHVYAYTALDVHRRLFPIADQGLAQSEPICIAAEFLCGDGGCRAPLTVHAMKHRREITALVFAQLREAIFHVLCRFGHTPHFEDRNLVRVPMKCRSLRSKLCHISSIRAVAG